MKAKLNKDWRYGKNLVPKGTEVSIIKGMEMDASYVLNIPAGMCYLCDLGDKLIYIPVLELTITDYKNIDWDKIRYEIAKEAALKMIDPKNVTQKYGLVALNACELADALIAELKKGGNK